MTLQEMGTKAVQAKFFLQKKSANEKNIALQFVANSIISNMQIILDANKEDILNAQNNGMHPGLVDRLKLDEERIEAMKEGVLKIIDLVDPIGEKINENIRPNGILITKQRVPIGVIGIIYESRPNVTVDAFALCFKTSNAVILKGGSDAIHSNIALANCIREGLVKAEFNPDVIQLIEDTKRETTVAFMQLKEYVDVLIPRGSGRLIQTVVEKATIPVIETGTGNCHVYVHEQADFSMAISIIVNAKTQRIGVCNACESLVVDKVIASEFLPQLAKALSPFSVEIRGDFETTQIVNTAILATEEDYGKEFLDYIISVKIVENEEEAIAHVNKYSTKHSDVIITKDQEAANLFLRDIDAACVYHNVSSRFSDGFEFGFGAEIGISTQKIHARGPMGLEALTTYKYIVEGNGQIRS